MGQIRKVLLIVLCMSLFGTVQPAQAGIFSGVCSLELVFHFSGSGMNGTTSAPDYEIEVRPFLADFDPLGWSGAQPCVVSGDIENPARDTFVTADNGDSTIFSCAAVAGGGNWDQGWLRFNGQSAPASVDGNHTIEGTWDNWVLTATNSSLTFTGAVQLRLSPFEHLTAARCATGNIQSLRMVGLFVFQDPEIP